jgi:hypothetical protein
LRANFALKHFAAQVSNFCYLRFRQFRHDVPLAQQERSMLPLVREIPLSGIPSQMSGVTARAVSAGVGRLMSRPRGFAMNITANQAMHIERLA